MTIAIVLTLFVLTVAIFATERIPIEVWSLLLMVVLVATGILGTQEAFVGFASSAVIMIAGVMLLTGSMVHNGAMEILAPRPPAPGRGSELRARGLLLATVNGVSAFINNVAATALFVPVAEGLARRFGADRRRYLMPIAFASMTGGVCTLIGTSTNIAVARAMEYHGLEPLGMFELAPVGLVAAAAGLGYLLLVAPRLLGGTGDSTAGTTGPAREFLYEVFVRQHGELVGATLDGANLSHYGITVLALVRGAERMDRPSGEQVIEAGDLLLVRGPAERIGEVRQGRDLEVKALPHAGARFGVGSGAAIVEATVAYNSPLVGHTLRESAFRQRHGVAVLAIHRRQELLAEKVGHIRLQAGDVLLLFGQDERTIGAALGPTGELIEGGVVSRQDPPRALAATLIFAAAVAAAASGRLDGPVAFMGGGALVLLFRLLPSREVATHVNFRFLVMVAGMVALGTAMERSGAATFLANVIRDDLAVSSPLVLLALVFWITVLLTQPLNNAAAALLMLPISIHGATALGVGPRPFVVCVAIAASCSFITPFEPANLLVYGKGQYRFVEFVKVGSLLTALVFVICMVLVPLLWPFRPA